MLMNLSYTPEDDNLYAVGLDNAHMYRFDSKTGAGTDLGVIAGLPTGGQMVMSTIFVPACEPFPGGGSTGGCFPGPGPFPAPEPATLALLGLGLAGLGFSHRRRKKS